MTFKSQP